MNYGAKHVDSVLISIRIPRRVADRLKQDANILDWSTSHLIRRILIDYVSCGFRPMDDLSDLNPSGFR